ncbi:Cell wall-associated hydrolase, NlpC family [Sporobacter termitidis DSM 10068]|uniref:Cell wall-associated hydrolase, NlpC family n=1 Tax=Sporobacter termitidis DSM 10068 TaxID=1123282 RepID=A0A1M5YMB9_9FIRM|nr:C40 family peptidase [Sporobacter termitidis]SHI13136.1 Cell wall-associated hydrolase, NlpC family [Sporobacter termitidis DSM 10068]
MRFLRKIFAVLIVFSFVVSALYISASAAGSIAYGAATVGATSLNIRSGPDTTYPIVETVPQNEKIVILEQTNDYWYHVTYNGATGYVATLYLMNVLTAENFTAAGKLAGDDVFMRSGPATSSGSLGTLDAGTVVNIIGINSGWYKVNYGGKTGYIRSDFIALISDDQVSSPSPAATAVTTTPLFTGELTQGQQLVNFALQFVGGSYVYGGASPSTGFDCSGFVYYVFGHYDYDLTRSASSQYANNGSAISKSDLQPGDLVFFSSNGGYSVTHVGIYIGNSQFVHASSPKVGVVVSDLNSGYYLNAWYGAKRILS